MARYIARRTAQALGVLWAAYTLAYVILELLPGDPVTLMAGGGIEQAAISPQQLAQLKTEYGYDDPFYVRYLHSLGDALHLDFGHSVQTGQDVTGLILDALPQTALLTVSALLIGVVVGSLVAISATYTRKRWLGQALLSLPTLGVSLPTFWVGLMLIQIVSFRWGLLPALGNEGVKSLILPAITLSLPTAALIGQILAQSLTATLADPYTQTAAAKGASRLRVHLRHALPNAIIPALTVLGVILGNTLAGSVVIETVFSRVGVGRLVVTAVGTQDIPVVTGVVVMAAVIFVVTNLVVDLLYPLLDPRIVNIGPKAAPKAVTA